MKQLFAKIFAIILFVPFFTNLLFLPGSNLLMGVANILYIFGQLVSFFSVILVPIGIIWLIIEVKNKSEKINFWALFVCIFPPICIFSTFILSAELRDFSRNIAIKNSEKMISDIENIKSETGSYPISLKKNYNSGIIGIQPYEYQKIDEENYILKFYQNVIINFNYEIVIFDKGNKIKNTEGEAPTFTETKFAGWKYEIYD